MVLYEYYEQLAQLPNHEGLTALLYLGQFDERVYEIVCKHNLAPAIVDLLPYPQAAYFLSRGMVYDDISRVVLKNFVRICSLLSRYESVDSAVTLAELIGYCGLPEETRLTMFNFSETYRHMILSRSYFPQRAVLRLLSYIFCDDMMSDAVAQLQFKSDILNHVNKVYVDTPDFVSWRFSVRVMSIAGGYNEDRSDVEDTEKLTRLVTKALPEFAIYFLAAFAYGIFRHYPQRVRGIVPRWLARQRAGFGAAWCGILGVFLNSYTEYRVYHQRSMYELRKSQEMRRRRGAVRRGVVYEQNPFFDSPEGATRRVFATQCRSYGIVAAALAVSMLPLTSVTFPKWLGDVPFRYPLVPRFFPGLLGMHAASRCLVPFVLAPFTLVTAINSNSCSVSLYDRYVEMRMRMWHSKHDSVFDASAIDAQVDIPSEASKKRH